MDNVSHSLPIPKRSFNSNSNVSFSSHNKSVYDDVFGAGPPKLGLPTLAPRLEDYSEIFAGGLHASRSFSIPVLILGDDDNEDSNFLHFDRDFDYTEVFGDSGGRVAFASSIEDLVGQPTGGYDSSDEPWSPAQSGSLSDEFDPLAGSDKSLRSSDVDANQSMETTKQFNASYNKSSQSNIVTELTRTTTSHATNFSALPGYTFSHYESPVSWDGEDDKCPVDVIDNLNGCTQERKYTKCSSNPENAQKNDFNLLEKHGISTSKPFVIVSDISLRTKPSQLPPPSRPPPALVSKKGDSDTSDSKLEPSKSCAFERVLDNSASLSLSPECRESRNKSVRVKCESTKECIERKDIRSHSAMPLEEEMLKSHRKGNKYISGSHGVEYYNRSADSYDGVVAWREETGYFEVIENNISTQAFDIIENCDLHKMVPENIQQFRESERQQADHTETMEVHSDSKGNLGELDAKLKVKASSEEDIGKRFIDAQITKQNSGKHKLNIPRDQQLACEVEKDNERLVEAGMQIKNESTYSDDKEHKLDPEKVIAIERNGDASKAEDNFLRFKRAEETEPIEHNKHEKEVDWDTDSHDPIEEDQLNELDGGCKLENNEENGQLKAEPNGIIYETGSGVDSPHVEGKSSGLSKSKNELQGGISHSATINDFESSCLPDQVTDVNIHGSGEMVDLNGKVEDAALVLKHSDDTLYSIKNTSSQKIERKDYNMKGNLAAKDQKVGERIREIELENEHLRKIEEEKEKEREREREKDRMAVDKAALEVREISYAEAHDRGALERATAEARQRAMIGARERLEKASMETKLRVERAAVERATAEARQRAAEKSMAQHAASEAHDRVERSVPDRFPASFRYADTRHNSLPSDIHLQSTGISSSLRYSYSFGNAGADGESPQRCKARLERYRRTAERAANALAEKNRRDLLAQREREERNRVAEALDAEIKRWSSGKEANLRALLSTLQYILGPDSGWQSVPLTEVITSAAVRKAYRKATLCVHPDKLQQRGATIQQKYICEKVFDLLKEAWNKFNSEER